MPQQQDAFQSAIEAYSDAQEAFRQQRDRMKEEAEFSNPADLKQWDQAALNIRTKGPGGARPCLTLDHTNQYIQQVVNACRQNRPGLEAFAASGGARVKVAQAIEGLFRHIEYRSRASIAYDTAVDHAARMSLGWIRVMPEVVNPKLNFQEVRISRVHNPLAVTPYPGWSEPDGMDLEGVFIEKNMTRKAFKDTYPGKSETPFDKSAAGASWFQEKMIRVAEHLKVVEKQQQRLIIRMPDGTQRDVDSDEYWLAAKEIGTQPMLENDYMGTNRIVTWQVMSGAEILSESVFPSRWTGMIPVIGNEVWIDEKRFLSGLTRAMMPAQRAYNYERSAYIEVVALQPKAPIQAAAESIAGYEDEYASANQVNKAYLPWNAYNEDGTRANPKPERMAPPSMPTAFAQGAQFADNDIQASIGMYRASLGAPAPEVSGVALRQKRQEGDTANFHIPDNLNRSVEMVGRTVVDMLPRVYDEKREAHILGLDGEVKPVIIDPKGDAYSERPDGATSINLGTGDYDVRVKAGPSYTSLREEASDSLNDLMKGDPALAAVVAPIWARMQDWPESDKLSKALLAMAPPQVQAALADDDKQDDPEVLKQQLQQCQQQLQHMQQAVEAAGQQLQEANADKAKVAADGQKARLDALTKAAQINVDKYQAETARLAVLAPAMQAPAVAALMKRMLGEVLGAPPLTGNDGAGLQKLAGPAQDANTTPQGVGGAPPGPLSPPEPPEPASAGSSLSEASQ